MDETFRALGHEHAADLEREARKWALAREAPTRRSLVPVFLGAIATLVVTVAVVATSSPAAPLRPDDRGIARGAAVAMPDLVDRALAREAAVAAPDLVERALARHRADDVRIAEPRLTAESAFDWTAAGIGASTASVLLVLAGGGFALARRLRTRSFSAS